jgi:hypothetical protein
MNFTINHKREPILRNIKTECCPTCKEPLSFVDAENDGAKCKCGTWTWSFHNPMHQESSAISDNNGWHFYPNELKKD